MFHLCGYVALPRTHPLNEVDYGVAEKQWRISVHGGLTFADFLPVSGERRYCYGFDCAHMFDLSSWRQFDDECDALPYYRDMQYVEDECKALIDQLINIENLVNIGRMNNDILMHKVEPCRAALHLWDLDDRLIGNNPLYCRLESGHRGPHRTRLKVPIRGSSEVIYEWRETND